MMHRYEELANRLRDRLLAGEWQIGDRFPTVADLMKEYNEGQAVVRDAVHQLQDEGYLDIRQTGSVVSGVAGDLAAGPLASIDSAIAAAEQTLISLRQARQRIVDTSAGA